MKVFEIITLNVWQSCIICPLLCYSLLCVFWSLLVHDNLYIYFNAAHNMAQYNIINVKVKCHYGSPQHWRLKVLSILIKYMNAKGTFLGLNVPAVCCLFWYGCCKNFHKEYTCASSLIAPPKASSVLTPLTWGAFQEPRHPPVVHRGQTLDWLQFWFSGCISFIRSYMT